MTDPAPMTPTPQPSPGAPSPSPSPAPVPGEGSNPTPSPAARPEYVPETFWDPATNSVKTQEFATHIGELAAIKAQHDARVAALPKDAAGYQIAPPEDFKIPEGWALDENHPLAAPVRAIAHKHQLPQEAVSDFVQAYSEAQIAAKKRDDEARAAEVAKLGTNGTQRVTASMTFWKSFGGEHGAGLFDHELTAGQYEVLEKAQAAISSQGGAAYNNSGREPAPKPDVPFAQKLWPKRQVA